MNKYGSSAYGEITTAAAERMLLELGITEDDVFYDLGSGLGKLVVQVYLTTDAHKCVGIEISKTRCTYGQNAKQQMQQRGWLKSGRKLDFLNKDMLECDLSDATVVYTCSAAFTPTLIEGLNDKLVTLQHLRWVVCHSPLVMPPDKWYPPKVIPLDMSWTDALPTYFYERR